MATAQNKLLRGMNPVSRYPNTLGLVFALALPNVITNRDLSPL